MTVACDRSLPTTFLGVKQIMVRTFGGDDVVNHTVDVDGPHVRPADLDVNLGAGNDAFSLDDSDVYSTRPYTYRPMLIAVQTGVGDDRVAAVLADHRDRVVEIDLGAGDDRLASVLQDDPFFSSPTRLAVLAGGGDDQVTATFIEPDVGDFVLRADLGAGDDTFEAIFITPDIGDVAPEDSGIGRGPAGFPAGRIELEVLGQAGDDSILARVGFNPQPDPPGEPWSFSLFADLGAGDDTFEAIFVEPEGPDVPAGRVQLDVLGQQGNDSLSLLIGGAAGPSPHMFTALTANFDGGGGSDVIMYDAVNVALDSSMRLNVFGSNSGDNVGINFSNVDVNGDVAVNVDGGDGADEVGIVIENSNIAAGGALEVTRTHSDGPDNIAFRANRLNVAAGGLFELNLFGGRGADTIMMIMEGGKIDGTARIMLDGGRGNDTIDARVQVDPTSRGTLDFAVLGGLGDDDLSLAIFGIDHELLDALVDGGPGYDVAFVSPFVLVRNCEEV